MAGSSDPWHSSSILIFHRRWWQSSCSLGRRLPDLLQQWILLPAMLHTLHGQRFTSSIVGDQESNREESQCFSWSNHRRSYESAFDGCAWSESVTKSDWFSSNNLAPWRFDARFYRGSVSNGCYVSIETSFINAPHHLRWEKDFIRDYRVSYSHANQS